MNINCFTINMRAGQTVDTAARQYHKTKNEEKIPYHNKGAKVSLFEDYYF